MSGDGKNNPMINLIRYSLIIVDFKKFTLPSISKIFSTGFASHTRPKTSPTLIVDLAQLQKQEKAIPNPTRLQFKLQFDQIFFHFPLGQIKPEQHVYIKSI